MSAAAQTAMKVTAETQLLMAVASGVPVLCRMMGIVKAAGDAPGKVKIGLVAGNRPWLVPHPIRGAAETTFDPDKFAAKLGVLSSGERHAALWLLNVWNPTYAKSKGWNFDLFAAFSSLDGENIVGIADWIINPVWP